MCYLTALISSCSWRDFGTSMFWLAASGGGLILLHALLLLILKYRRKSSEKQKGYEALTFPIFEIFLLILSLSRVWKASTTLTKGQLHIHFSLFIIDIGSKNSTLDIQLLFEAQSMYCNFFILSSHIFYDLLGLFGVPTPFTLLLIL